MAHYILKLNFNLLSYNFVFSKRMMCIRIFFCRPFNGKKTFAYVICGAYLVQPFDITFMSLNDFSFKKVVFKKGIV
jgi:hypothetical protein